MEKGIWLAACLTAVLGAMPAGAWGQNVKSIVSGATWTATDGTSINAHGGGMLYEDGYYYWFGEHREGMKSAGVSVYRSKDLYNWENLGLALTPQGERTNTLQDISEGRLVERPKVIKNEKTGKYVMWGHWEDGEDYSKARVVVATADKIEGPYTFVRTLRPNGQESRDQTVFRDDDGRAYHIRSSENNMTVHCTLLSDDYTKPTDTYERIIPEKQYEAPAIMKIGDTYIGFFSGCTSWDPNPGHVLMTKDLMSAGDWRDLGNPCIDDGAETTYRSQSTFVLKVEGYEDAYMFMADRWNKSNIETSTYVWLPIHLRTGYPMLRWYDSWDLSIFEQMARFKRAASLEDGNTYVLLSRLSDRMLSSDEGNICLYNDDEGRNLQFVFEAVDGEEDTYRLKDVATGQCLEASGSSLRLAPEGGSTAQQWVMERQGDKFYVVKSRQNGRVLTVKDGSTKNKAQVVLDNYAASNKTKFGLYFDSKRFDYEEDDPFVSPKEAEDSTTVGVPAAGTDGGNASVRCEGGSLVVRPGTGFEGMNSLTLYDAAGRCLLRTEAASVAGVIVIGMPAGLSEGLYMMRVENGMTKAVRTLKFIHP